MPDLKKGQDKNQNKKKKMEIEKIQKHIDEFNAILEKLSGRGKTQVAIAIIQEMNKDRRMEEINNMKNNNNEKATEKQKWLLRELGVPFSEDLSKREASALISETLNNGQTA